jgi:3-dehydroquinate dehydratase/shikimate dehydrogenase
MDWIASLVAEATSSPLEALQHPPEGATIVELRLDHFPQLDPAAAVATCPLPLLLTLRSTAEGGRGPSSPAERRPLLEAAHEAGAALLDLELERDLDLVDRLGLPPERLVISWHDPSGTPENLDGVAGRLLATRARWVKLIPTTRSLADLAAVIALNEDQCSRRAVQRRLITFGMGPAGIPSRMLAPLLGPPLAYVAWSARAAAAPGQLTFDQLQATIGHLSGRPQRLLGVVGADASRSLSPRMHAAAFRTLGLHDIFVPLSVPDAAELAGIFVPQGRGLLDRLGLPTLGWAVTTPYKQAAADAATRPSPRVRTTRSANTLIPAQNAVMADTTDADGAVGSLRQLGIDPVGTIVVVQGTGGAGRAAALGLGNAGAAVLLRGRDETHTRDQASRLGVGFLAPDERPATPAVLVNATPLGSGADDACPFAEAEVRDAAGVIDMVYGSEPTRLAVLAGHHGVRLADGRDFLAQQGFSQLAAFLRTVPPREVMRAALG